jgi:hypothetical protein
MRFKNVFVLSPGRSGSKTFIEAASHLSNYSSAHESLSSKIGEARFAYPINHIEADNRLTWFMGDLAQRYSGDGVLYVHLIRDLKDTADSFHHRLKNSNYRSSIMNAFAYGILMKPGEWSDEEELPLARFYVETVHKNISTFIADKEHCVVHLEDGGASFAQFLSLIGAEGDIKAAQSKWLQVHNAR